MDQKKKLTGYTKTCYFNKSSQTVGVSVELDFEICYETSRSFSTMGPALQLGDILNKLISQSSLEAIGSKYIL